MPKMKNPIPNLPGKRVGVVVVGSEGGDTVASRTATMAAAGGKRFIKGGGGVRVV